jgi:hypothetical protein
MVGRIQRPTKRRNNWKRLQAVLDWANLTANSFAMRLGLTRAEHLYQIKKGNFGISPDLADRIVDIYPEINRDWLITGIGNMLLSDKPNNTHIPYFDIELETLLPIIDQCEPTRYVDVLPTSSCDIIVKALTPAMIGERSVIMQLFLRQVDITHIDDDKEYVFIINKEVIWRIVESIDGYKLNLRAINNHIFSDMTIDLRDITMAWQVAAKMEVFEQ